MKNVKICERVYGDGSIFPHTEKEIKVNYPVYTLFRHEPEEYFDTFNNSIYSIVAQYGDGTCNNWLFFDKESALRTFRILSAVH